MTRSWRDCLAFLRELEGHAVATLRGRPEPDHASACPPCRDRLQAATRQARLLTRIVPAVPEALREEAFLEGIYDRVLARRSDAVEQVLETTLRSSPAPEELDWPTETLGDPATVESIGIAPGPVPAGRLWARVRRDLEGQIAARRRKRLRFRVQAALVAAGLVVGAWFASNWGTPKAPVIVFEELADMPAVDLSPAAVLRRAHGD